MAAVQSCPALKKAATAMPSAVGPSVGVVKDDHGAFPPSSRWTRFKSAAAVVATSIPALTLPVMATMAGMRFATRARPVSRSPQTTLRTPGGK